MKALLLKCIFWLQIKVKTSYLKKNRALLTNNDFTIICSNCWGGILYKDLGLPYKSPFVNMFMHAPCFVKLLSDLNHYLAQELQFNVQSKYLLDTVSNYPIGRLDDVEIHFIHYKSEQEVLEKWNERKKRMNLDNVIAVFSERDKCSPLEIEKFDALPFANKICFTVNKYPFKSTVYLNVFSFFRQMLAADLIAGITYDKVNIISFLNHASTRAKNRVANY